MRGTRTICAENAGAWGGEEPQDSGTRVNMRQGSGGQQVAGDQRSTTAEGGRHGIAGYMNPGG